ncbi:transglycosylase domain-containing protein [Priestia koreensis]|uniref:transglycosylase domain-containing protein n=1 Tax=Priestia koreensis TaxID=284581 RepID=UPI003458CC4A
MRKISLFLVMVGMVTLLLSGCSFQTIRDIRHIDAKKLAAAESTVLYDKDGDEIDKLYTTVPRENVDLSDLPDYVRMAFISTEDKRFYDHGGIDFKGIFRATTKNIVTFSKAEGASTITQQLARNLFLTNEKTFTRKFKEVILSYALENKLSKDQILELYLNQVYFGSGVYGIGAASKLYFQKDASDLSVSEAAILAGLPKAPSRYSPSNDPKLTKQRRDVVLQLMYNSGVITEGQLKDAKNEDIEQVSVPSKEQSPNQAFIDYIVKDAGKTYGVTRAALYKGGYKIYTDFDPDLQESLNQAVDQFYFADDRSDQKVEIGAAALNPKNGMIQAMYGGRSYKQNGLNRATVPYQPGSSIKPLAVYAPALETNDWTPDSTLKDERGTDFNGYKPKNAGGEYFGKVTVEEALVRSLNVATVTLLNEIGVSKGYDFVTESGIPLDKGDKNLALALGGLTKGASPLQMAQAYTTFANDGVLEETRAIKKIVFPDGVIQSKELQTKEMMSKEHADQMNEMLMKVVDKSYGTGHRAQLYNEDVAGKTGTTLWQSSNRVANKDAWFAGYTDKNLLVIHAGFDRTDNSHYLRSGGGDVPARIFRNTLRSLP